MLLESNKNKDSTEYLRKRITTSFFTIRRSDKFWSGVWSDSTIEQVLMCSMKSNGGLTRGRGITDTVFTLLMIYLQNIWSEVVDFSSVNGHSSEQLV